MLHHYITAHEQTQKNRVCLFRFFGVFTTQCELLPSYNVRRASSTIASNDMSSEIDRPRALIFGM